MSWVRAMALAAALVTGTRAAAAQDTAYRQRDTAAMVTMGRWMDSLDARLDSLVSRMNAATGDRKVTAMAEVVNELVAQRRIMRQRMPSRMEGRPMMPRGRRLPPGHPPVRPDSAPGYGRDTAR